MKSYPVVVLVLLCLLYALYFGRDQTVSSGTKLCSKNIFSNIASYRAHYPSVYSKLILGCRLKDTEPDDKAALDLFYRTGTGHLLSIAGLHLGGISLIIYFFLNLGFYLYSWRRKKSFFPFFRISFVISLTLVLFYVLLIGPELPRMRALIMMLLSAASVIFILLRNKYVVLALTACAILLFTPGSIYSYSFYYSFMCVLGIFLSPSKKGLNICMIIFAFILPLNLHSSGLLDLSSIISNFVAIPVFVFIYFPLQLCFFGLFSMGSYGVIEYMDHITAPLLKLLYLMDSFGNYIRIKIPPVDTVEAVVLYITLFAAMFVLFYSYKLNKKRVLIIYSLFCVISVFYSIYFYNKYIVTQDSLTVFDITKPQRYNGSGDFMLIRTGGFNILVDTGYGDASVKKAVLEIRRLKITTIDYLVLSHTDVDHVGGLDYVLNSSGLYIKRILLSPCMQLKKDQFNFGGEVSRVCSGSEVIMDSKNKIKFIHPECNTKGLCSNDSALVSIVEMNSNKIFLTSDTPVRILKNISYLKNTKDLSRTIFQFPHHCSSRERPEILFENSKPVLGFCTRSQSLLKSGITPSGYAFPVLMTGRCGNINIEFEKDKIKIPSQRCSKVYNFI